MPRRRRRRRLPQIRHPRMSSRLPNSKRRRMVTRRRREPWQSTQPGERPCMRRRLVGSTGPRSLCGSSCCTGISRIVMRASPRDNRCQRAMSFCSPLTSAPIKSWISGSETGHRLCHRWDRSKTSRCRDRSGGLTFLWECSGRYFHNRAAGLGRSIMSETDNGGSLCRTNTIFPLPLSLDFQMM